MVSLQMWVKEGHSFGSLTQVTGGAAEATSFFIHFCQLFEYL